MNFYPFHIGDYATHTGHLEPLEDLAYRRLLDLYYLREGPLPADIGECARLIRLRSSIEAVEVVLREFFIESELGWSNMRCDEELGRMMEKQAKAKASAEASVAARKARAERSSSERLTNAERTLNEGLATNTNTNTNTNTINSSSTKKKAKPPIVTAKPVDVDDDVWLSFLTVRKAKRLPLTEIAMLGIRQEAVKAGKSLNEALTLCCQRGWGSIKAEWLEGRDGAKNGLVESFYERDQRLKREEAAKWGGSSRELKTIDAEVFHVPVIESR